MNEERANHNLQMAEIVAKVNDFPNHVTIYFEKKKINLKRTIIIDQAKVATCKNRTNSMCNEGDHPKNRIVAKCFKEGKSVGRPSHPSSSQAKGVIDYRTTYIGKFKMDDVELSHQVDFNSTMKRKKAREIPLACLRNNNKSF